MPYGVFQNEDGEYCVYKVDDDEQPVGESLGCHDTEEGARRQIRAIGAATHANLDISVEMMREICPGCAEAMEKRNLKLLKIRDGKLATKQMPPQLLRGLCDAIGDDPGFFTRCMSKPFGAFEGSLAEKESFCAWLHHECLGVWPGERSAARPGGLEFKQILAPPEALPLLLAPAGEAAAPDPRVRTQVFAVYGHVDDRGDLLHYGAAAKTIQERAERVRVLWSHDGDSPPIGVPLHIAERPMDALPPGARAFYAARYPAATGVLMADVKYLDTPRGNEVLAAIDAGALRENSIGFVPVNGKVDFTTLDRGGEKRRVRNVREFQLWDLSPVNWGAQPATLNLKRVGALHWDEEELVERPLALLATLDREMKEGRVLSAANVKRLRDALALLQEILMSAEPVELAGGPLTAQVLERLRQAQADAAALKKQFLTEV